MNLTKVDYQRSVSSSHNIRHKHRVVFHRVSKGIMFLEFRSLLIK
jgi:hypothetical protein